MSKMYDQRPRGTGLHLTPGRLAMAAVLALAAMGAFASPGGPLAATFEHGSDLATGAGPQRVVVADINGDSQPDIITGNSTDGTLSVFLNEGSGAFSSKTDFPAGGRIADVAIADLNGDGEQDAVTANPPQRRSFPATSRSCLVTGREGLPRRHQWRSAARRHASRLGT